MVKRDDLLADLRGFFDGRRGLGDLDLGETQRGASSGENGCGAPSVPPASAELERLWRWMEADAAWYDDVNADDALVYDAGDDDGTRDEDEPTQRSIPYDLQHVIDEHAKRGSSVGRRESRAVIGRLALHEKISARQLALILAIERHHLDGALGEALKYRTDPTAATQACRNMISQARKRTPPRR